MNYKKKSLFIYGTIIICFLFSLLGTTLAQLNIPYSSRAFLEYQIVPVYSKISGDVDKIFVKDKEIVKINQPLFSLNKELYNASYLSVLGSYNQTIESIKTLKNDIKKNKNIVSSNKNIYDRNINELKKYKSLYKKRYISEIDLDNLTNKVTESEKTYKESLGKLQNLLVKYNKNENSMSSFLIALGALEKAKLNLKYTTILAPINGEVVMNNFYKNTSIKSNSTIFYIKNNDVLKVNATFKEKGVSKNINGRKSLILFDGIPNKIFKGYVEKIDPILSQGYSSSSSLVKIENDNRWVRDSGEVRVSIIIQDSKNIKELSSGSKASVILLSPNDNSIYNFFAKIWIHIIKGFNYVY